MAIPPEATLHPAIPFVDAREFFRRHRADVESAVNYIVRSKRLRREDAEDLASEVWVKVLQEGHRVIGAFRGQASLRSYLTAVVRNVLNDRRTQNWGKWRPGVRARRSGPLAVQLDRLMCRDGLSYDQAFEHLTTHHAAPPALVEAARTTITIRQSRRLVPLAGLELHATAASAADRALRDRDCACRTARARAALRRALAELTDEERELLFLRFVEGQTIANISRATGRPQKALYRVFERIVLRLRSELEADGVSATMVSDVVGGAAADLSGLIAASQSWRLHQSA